MPEVSSRTYPFWFVRIGLYGCSGVVQFFIIYFTWKMGLELTRSNHVLNYISQPAFMIIGIGLSALFNATLIRLIAHIISMAHTIAATIAALELEYEGSLTGYAWKQMSLYFQELSSSSFISIKSVEKFSSLKNAILFKDIMPLFAEPKNFAIKCAKNYVVKDVQGVLSMVDEIIVSYVWFTTMMYFELSKEANDAKNTRKFTTRVARQARFMLEGVLFLLRVFPKLMLANLGMMVVYFLVTLIIVLGFFYAVWAYIGFSLWILPIIFLTWRLVVDIVNNTLIYSMRVDHTITTFYDSIHGLDAVGIDDLVALVQKIPSLTNIAKKSKLPQFKDLADVEPSVEDSGGLVDIGDMKKSLIDSVNNAAGMFMVKETDILKIGEEVPSDEDGQVEGVEEENSEAEQSVEDTPVEGVEESAVEEPASEGRDDEEVMEGLPEEGGSVLNVEIGTVSFPEVQTREAPDGEYNDLF